MDGKGREGVSKEPKSKAKTEGEKQGERENVAARPIAFRSHASSCEARQWGSMWARPAADGKSSHRQMERHAARLPLLSDTGPTGFVSPDGKRKTEHGSGLPSIPQDLVPILFGQAVVLGRRELFVVPC